MKEKNRLGGYLAAFGSVLGIVGTYLIFMKWYSLAQHAEAAEPGCEILLGYLMPALSDFAIVAGAMYAVGAYGFFTARKWAFPLVVVANVLALQGSWFINVPFMAASMPPVYFTIFFPNLLIYFVLLRSVGKVSWGRALLGMLLGAAFIFCFMNGVASWSRIITIGRDIYIWVQRLNWIAFIAMGFATVGFILRPKEWVRVTALTAALIELVVGIPLVIATTISLGRFSLFSLAPISCLAIIVLFVWPGFWEKITRSEDSQPEALEAAAATQA
jgi:hypothetical protein